MRVQIIVALLMACTGTLVQAQNLTWEDYYGGTCSEYGFNGVTPVTSACGGGTGYISVGFSTSPSPSCSSSDVYVIRSANPSGTMWEYTYDIASAGGNDRGMSVHVLPNNTGFIIVGTTDLGVIGADDIFLMKIDCEGNVVWCKTYGSPTQPDIAFDVIGTTTGTLPTTRPNDLVVCGATWVTTPVGHWEGYLFRVDFNGSMVGRWGETYTLANSPADELFLSLTEVAPAVPGIAGDIVAVGKFGNQGLVVRVDGNTGLIGPAPQGSTLYGQCEASPCGDPNQICGNQIFNSVIELKNPAERTGGIPNVVIAGTTDIYKDLSDPGLQGNDIYMVKLAGGDPTVAPLIQTWLGDGPCISGHTWNIARSIREIPQYLTGYARTYDLVVAGEVSNQYIDRDVLLVTVDPATLRQAPGTISQQYGINLYGENEGAWSVAPVNAYLNQGFIICGYHTSSNPGSDPSDMYLIKTNPAGQTGCSSGITKFDGILNWTTTPITFSPVALTREVSRYGQRSPQEWLTQYCPSVSFKKDPNTSQPSTGQGQDFTTLRAYPNPLKAGAIFTVEFLPSTTNPIHVIAVDMGGHIVYDKTMTNTGNITPVFIETDSWASGSYTVTVSDGLTSESTRFVVE